uniref:non-specific serine/threonine protein kinase n=1 Tax=Culex pipiens TaxID=7175 RepID=A0A8D8GZC3_CULPI
MNSKNGNTPSASRNSAYNAAALEKIKNDLKSYESGQGASQNAPAKLIRKTSIEREVPQTTLHLPRNSPALDSGAGSSRSNSPHSQQLVSSRVQFSPSPCPTNFSEAPPLPPPRCPSTPSTPPPLHQFLKRMSPASVTTSRNGQFQSQSPARGTSPISSNSNLRQPIIVQNGPQVQQQVNQQISAYYSGSTTEPPPPYPISSSQVTSQSAAPPSYMASLQCRQSPTQCSQDFRKSPSSGIYSNPSAGSPSPITVGQNTTSSTKPVALPPVRSARQTNTQHPIIMHSVKSTQVQKPVLQTAIAPSSPTAGSSMNTIQNNCSSAPPPPSYATSLQQIKLNKKTSNKMTNSTMLASNRQSVSFQAASNGNNAEPQQLLTNSSDPPSYDTTMILKQKQPQTRNSHPPPPYTDDSMNKERLKGIDAHENGSGHNNEYDIVPTSCSTNNSFSNGIDNTITVNSSSTSNYIKNNNYNDNNDDNLINQNSNNNNNDNLNTNFNINSNQNNNSNTNVIYSSATNYATKNSQCIGIPTNSNAIITIHGINQGNKTYTGDNNDCDGNNINNNSCYVKQNNEHSSKKTLCTVSKDPINKQLSPVAGAVVRGNNQLKRNDFNRTTNMSEDGSVCQDENLNRKMSLSGEPSRKIKHQSPIPERRNISKEKEAERFECKVRHYSPQAYKFFMEQHIENVLKSYTQRNFRIKQLESEMSKLDLPEETKIEMRKLLCQKESNYIRLKRAKMDKSMFARIKTIGVGAFGEVTLVKKIDTPNHLYAMKTLRKADVLKRNQVAHVKAERDILAEADNEWVVKLYYSFQDKDNLYFVMDYIPGGDLMSLLIKKGIFEEELARFYVAELTCAIESVHKMGFIHRDIKPDNVLIDRKGHIKLTDFGLCTGFRWTHDSKYYQKSGDHTRQDSMEAWSKAGSEIPPPLERRKFREKNRAKAHSIVGTPNYIAPEVLLRSGYTQLCDWWSVGVILFEMLVGQPPFLANTAEETQIKVINWRQTLKIPVEAQLSKESQDIILRLCKNEDERIGRNVDEIKSHPFFRSIDFSKDLRSQPAPYEPKIKYPTDTSNFDPIDQTKLHDSSCDDTGHSFDEVFDSSKPFHHGFFEFTFRRFFDDEGDHKITLDANESQTEAIYV